ncbi:hypothetical protein B1C78_02920 [Thioalkalivibrio denitrificans]|uniref:Uncharacterized protein n=1 Tax=Thioalkalivibrio denitrificans TaxID=108003 RepID=A0A1V3NS26_9GAMM|nr:hypothetical protein [Thioalkalivibrio denitrificans]OOG27622.1 hypothetical protein B1C78_02920 [Thioalkalivibrio denitrificans]
MDRSPNRSALSDYFAYLEARYGEQFSLDVLTDEELARLAGLGAQALADQPEGGEVPTPLGALLGLVRGKLELRAQHRLISSRLSS